MTRALYVLFVLSGAAGLIYESIWARYLGLFLGHDAYAQIIVLVIFLGGMSAGAMAVSRRSEQRQQPLRDYALIEFAVGCIGLGFHDVFQATTGFAYQSLFPALAGSWGLTGVKWLIAAVLILPQSLLLGATFPLMSAGMLRLGRSGPGRSLALLYFTNSLGAAGGVLLAGFYLVDLAGLPGTLVAAAMLNLTVALGTLAVVVRGRQLAPDRAESESLPKPAVEAALPAAAGLPALLLFTSFGTAVASFIYEIDWIRMLSLVLGSATHAFELMLSAFILGLALGSYWIRSRLDRLENPVRALGIVQWVMGCLALATLPLYVASFDWIAALMLTFARSDSGYAAFNVARYGLCLIIMLPATFCAGMTLPLITRTLFLSGTGERAIGAVYGWNTLGAIVGVVVGGLVLVPAVGLKATLIAGASLDIAIGTLLIACAVGRRPARRLAAGLAVAAGVAVVVTVSLGTRLEQRLLVSGVYRGGNAKRTAGWDVPFYQDGRTASVAITRVPESGFISLITNGKADASLGAAWFQQCSSSPRVPLAGDAATQTLLPLVALAHVPQARTAAVIGQGSGMSSHHLLASPRIQRLVTVEIEPEIIAASRAFYPANRRAFDDPRSEVVIDDAKSYFAAQHRRYDLILSEPSNPWVSGVSGLFTTEFYARVRAYLTDDGVFGQWLHMYELDDGLVLSVLAALHDNFRAYEVFAVASGDLLVVASNRPELPRPDWSLFAAPAIQNDLCHFLPITPDALEHLRLIGRRELTPVIETLGQPNSDFYPILDLGAERRRYLRQSAGGFQALSADWYNLLASISGRRSGPGTDLTVALPGTPRISARAFAARLIAGDTIVRDTLSDAVMQQVAYSDAQWRAALAAGQAPKSWQLWLDQMAQLTGYRDGGRAGTTDERIYREAMGVLHRHPAPEPVGDVIAFRRAVATWDFATASRAADRLLPVAIRERRWVPPDELRDGAVMAKLHLGDVAGARAALESLAPFSTRAKGDLRSRLLESYVAAAEQTLLTRGRRSPPRSG